MSGGSAYFDDCGVCDDNPSNDNATCSQDCAGIWGGFAYEDPCGTCDDDTTNDGYFDDCNVCDNDPANDGVLGCTDSNACNYNISAGCDDGSCISPDGICDTCSGVSWARRCV